MLLYFKALLDFVFCKKSIIPYMLRIWLHTKASLYYTLFEFIMYFIRAHCNTTRVRLRGNFERPNTPFGKILQFVYTSRWGVEKLGHSSAGQASYYFRCAWERLLCGQYRWKESTGLPHSIPAIFMSLH